MLARSLARCPWVPEDDPLYVHYHDEEWGVPLRDDRLIFEFLVLESFQAGLSWRTVLYKRDNFRRAFAGFDYARVARFGARDVARLMNDVGIIRNRAKIDAAVNNAHRFQEVRGEFGSFSDYMWSRVGGSPLQRGAKTLRDIPAYTAEALAWSKDLKKRGFRFLGPTVVYSHMQATGMVNDHTVECFRHLELAPRRIK
jgi:DNA-3-methyladenine glycosylase I